MLAASPRADRLHPHRCRDRARLLGALQGSLIGRLGINSLVFTIGTLILLRGVTYMLSDNAPIMLDEFRDHRSAPARASGSSRWSIIVALIVFVLAGFFLAYTRWGREIYAIGGARNEAIAAGVPRVRPLTIAFAISAFLREPRRRACRDARRQRGAAELRAICCCPAAPRRCSAASASTAGAAPCSMSRSASRSCPWSAPGLRRAAARRRSSSWSPARCSSPSSRSSSSPAG